MVCASKGTSKAAGSEGQGQHLAVELGNLCVGLNKGPRAALDLGQCLKHIRPGAAKGLNVPCASGSRN